MGLTGFIAHDQSAGTCRQFTQRIVVNQGFIWEISTMKYFLMIILFFLATSASSQLSGKVERSKGDSLLGEVVVTAKKELTKHTPGGKVFNIQLSLLTKGSNALQVLERLPGVITDRRNNQFSLNGQSGVTVLFNGRRVGLSMEELMNLLESTVADNIDKIELITSADAKYDADGSGGIINIIFKKSEQEGTRVNASATLGYGYRGKAVGSISLSHGFKNASVFGSYSWIYDGVRSGFMGDGTNEDLLYKGSTLATFSGISRRFQNTHNINLTGEIRPGLKNTAKGGK